VSNHDHAQHDHSGHDQPGTKPIRQEKQKATEDITELAPGVLRSQLPIELPGLGHVNCYMLQDGDGVALVDPGLPGEDNWRALEHRLDKAGYRVSDVHTVICTHSHPDHFGGAARLAEESGADIVTHAEFGNAWNQIEDPEFFDLDGEAVDVDPAKPLEGTPWEDRRLKTPWGSHRKPPPPEIFDILREDDDVNRFRMPKPSRRIVDGQIITLARREWVAVHTPGHTADHLCLFDPEEGIMLSGDHVLPTITPHIGGMFQDVDPLQQFFTSLDRMHTFDTARLVLPAHGHPFEDLAGRSTEIIDHHRERLQQLVDAASVGEAATVSDYMKMLFRERSWGDMAESETYAHLDHLKRVGRLTAADHDGMMTFSLPSENV